MAKVEIYTSPMCGYCSRAKALLDKKGAVYTEVNVMMNSDKRSEMVKRAKGKTSVPQIFIDDKHIGGCDDLFELDFDDELDPLLAV